MIELLKMIVMYGSMFIGSAIVVFGLCVLGWVVYLIMLKDWFDYRKARKYVFRHVKSYKDRCSGNNRFVVTVETLQDVFREYDTPIIERVWVDLVNQHLIEKDPMDGEWCVR